VNQTTTYTSKILYADDDYDDHFFLRESISSSGLSAEIVYLTDGEQVICYLDELDTNALPSLIVLDLNMPKRNGKQTLEYLKRDDRYAAIPVIILSTSDNRLDKEYCTDKGAASYLVKPGHFSGYNDIVRTFIPYLQPSF
jgi:CheY-like chemotaxis protein